MESVSEGCGDSSSGRSSGGEEAMSISEEEGMEKPVGVTFVVYRSDEVPNPVCTLSSVPYMETVGNVIRRINALQWPCKHLKKRGSTTFLRPELQLYVALDRLDGSDVDVVALVEDPQELEYEEHERPYYGRHQIQLIGADEKLEEGTGHELLCVNHRRGELNVVVPREIAGSRIILCEYKRKDKGFREVQVGSAHVLVFYESCVIRGSGGEHSWGFEAKKPPTLYRYLAFDTEGIVVGCSKTFCLYTQDKIALGINEQTLSQHFGLLAAYNVALLGRFDLFWSGPYLSGDAPRWQRQMYLIQKYGYGRWGELANCNEWWIKRGRHGVAAQTPIPKDGNISALPFYYEKFDCIFWYVVVAEEAQPIVAEFKRRRMLLEQNPKHDAVSNGDNDIFSTERFLALVSVHGVILSPARVREGGTVSASK